MEDALGSGGLSLGKKTLCPVCESSCILTSWAFLSSRLIDLLEYITNQRLSP